MNPQRCICGVSCVIEGASFSRILLVNMRKGPTILRALSVTMTARKAIYHDAPVDYSKNSAMDILVGIAVTPVQHCAGAAVSLD